MFLFIFCLSKKTFDCAQDKPSQKRTLFTHPCFICYGIREYKVFRRNFCFAEPHLKLRVTAFLISKLLSEYPFEKEVFSFVLGVSFNLLLLLTAHYLFFRCSWCALQLLVSITFTHGSIFFWCSWCALQFHRWTLRPFDCAQYRLSSGQAQLSTGSA